MAYSNSRPYTVEMQKYATDFWHQVTKTEKRINEFLSFYPQWAYSRKNAIKCVEKLLEEFTAEEKLCDTIKTISSSVTLFGKAANSSKEKKSDSLKNVSLIGHGISFWFTTRRVFAIENAKEKLRSIIVDDYSLTKCFVRMGLDCERLLNRTKIRGDKMKKMDWSSASELIRKEIRKSESPCTESCGRNSVSSTSSNMASALANIVETSEKVVNVMDIVHTYLEDNPAVKITLCNAVDLAPELASILSDSGNKENDIPTNKSSLESMTKDWNDITETYQRLTSGTSETQKAIRDALESLINEYNMLKRTFVKLSAFRRKNLNLKRYPYVNKSY